MQMSAILFDMDGVLINTRQEIEDFWRRWAIKAGFELTGDDIENHIHGCPPSHTIGKFFGQAEDEFMRAMEADSRNIGKNARAMIVPGLTEFVGFLCERQFPFGIVTSHTLKSASSIALDIGLAGKYKTLVTVDQVKNGKPHPEPYLLAAERLNLIPEEVLVFEDSLSGCTSALRAGMNVVAINTPEYETSLRAVGVVHVIRDFHRVHEAIEAAGLQFK